jgi:hypothetical protein
LGKRRIGIPGADLGRSIAVVLAAARSAGCVTARDLQLITVDVRGNGY